jgi:hypothetical protein
MNDFIMKKILIKLSHLLLLFSIFHITTFSFAQKDATELIKAQQQIEKFSDVFFKAPIKDNFKIQNIPKYISIVKYQKNKNLVYAYVHKSRFINLLELQIPFEVISRDINTKTLTMANTVGEMANWDRYPTYEVYIQMMYDFAANYPDISRLETIGYSQNGKEILALKITDNPDEDENEPRFLYTGQMHGNEIPSYVLLLRLSDYLLSNYNTISQVTDLVDNIEIWINPLANPDGTYQGGNHTVSGASRYLLNGVDPNRNFPAPDSEHPDGNDWAQETIDMMTFADEHNIVLSANLHTGAEVVNYPWDTWTSSERTHADDDWWQFVSHEYADTVFANSSGGYFTGISPDGITEGGDWYVIFGGRQDYMTYFKQGREFTLELSNINFLDAEELPTLWNYNYNSFLLYLEQSHYGIRGIITDSDTGFPIDAKVEVEDHDDDNSFVFSSLPVGNYHRLIYAGNYDLTYSKDGYVSQTISNINVNNYSATIQDIALVPEELGVYVSTFSENIIVAPNPVTDGKTFISFNFPISETSISMFDCLGRKVYEKNVIDIKEGELIELTLNNKITKGVYLIQINSQKGIAVKRIINF